MKVSRTLQLSYKEVSNAIIRFLADNPPRGIETEALLEKGIQIKYLDDSIRVILPDYEDPA